MQFQRHIWSYFQQYKSMHIWVKTSTSAAFGLIILAAMVSVSMIGARTSLCPNGSQGYTVVGGDTLSGIATRYGTNWHSLAAYNHIADPNLIYVRQVVCIPGHDAGTNQSNSGIPAPSTIRNSQAYSIAVRNAPSLAVFGNLFPYGYCTWWANQRYYQLHGRYVPWTTNSNAWAWTDRAYQFGWHVSSRPTLGAIIDLQPGVQGAYGSGHVAVVEWILGNGRVIASSMNWGGHGSAVTDATFTVGPGVSFISQY